MAKDKERITITFDPETWGAEGKTELPFVAGVLADFSGGNTKKPAFKDRRFVRVDKDNFNATMAKIAPSVSFTIDDLWDTTKEIPVTLTFKKLEDFHPDRLVQAIPDLKRLIQMRDRVRQLAHDASRLPNVRAAIQEIVEYEAELRAQEPASEAADVKGE